MRRAVVVLLVCGVLAGVAGGIGGAVALPPGQESLAPALAPPEPSPRATPPRVVDEARQASQDLGDQDLRELEDSVELEARVSDPRGGPDWAVRVFDADEVPPGGGEPDRMRCAQLGRVYQGTFGWVDAANVFRPVAFDLAGAPAWCGPPGGSGGEPTLRFETLITDPAAGAAVPQQTVAWGYAGAAAEEVEVRLGERVERPELSRRGAFVVPAGPEVGPQEVRIAVTGDDGERTVERFGRPGAPAFADALGPGGRPVARYRQLDEPAHVQARAPDPAGGLPFGVAAAPGTDGSSCATGPGRIVGDRVGRVDFALGTFFAFTPRGCTNVDVPPALPTPGGEHPFFTGGSSGGGVDWELGADPQSGRVARRTLEGTGVFTGQSRRDVVTITIATSRDVRTLRPAGPSNSFLAVYPGGLPLGEITVTATFADGSTSRQVLPNLDL